MAATDKQQVETGNVGKSAAKTEHLSRRQFVVGVAGLGIGAAVGAGITAAVLPENVYAIDTSDGYLLVDTKKCAGCQSCMLACSVAHEGKSNLALSRIQVKKNVLDSFPEDVGQHQCRQCVTPSCVHACPTGANHVDPKTHVRMVNQNKCIGCERCVEACPFTPSRMQWNFEAKHAQKCDLCIDTPYWDKEGGPGGKQACISVCPMKAIKFASDVPAQDDKGYEVNLRNLHYARVGYPIDDEGKVPAAISLEQYGEGPIVMARQAAAAAAAGAGGQKQQ